MDHTDLENLKKMSARIGRNDRLIQGAGGNSSFKTTKKIWVKGSGVWMSEAEDRDIFVSLDLPKLRNAIENNHENPTEASQLSALKSGGLYPSIETTLHAMMPHQYVLHTHAIDVLALAVCADAEWRFSKQLMGLNWVFVPYARPGLPLTLSMKAVMSQDDADVLILENHGLVVGGASVSEIDTLLANICKRCSSPARKVPPPNIVILENLIRNSVYRLPKDSLCHTLATDPNVCKKAQAGSLYPDHVVFLGHGIATHDESCDLPDGILAPMALALPGIGVVVRRDIPKGAEAMLKCLAEVLLQVPDGAPLSYLTLQQESELLDWDAEKIRQNMNC